MELIKSNIIDRIIGQYALKITAETTNQEMIKIIREIIYKSINSIDPKVITELVSKELANDLRKRGLNL